ncbi:MAG: phosphate acyltransferase PlsX [Rhodospirillales bacterium]|nr:phosphate acyltransferase PlsX [Rhodospirillales bacterium]
MGGDHAPRMVIEGMNRAIHRLKNVRFLVFGRTDEISPLMNKFRRLRAFVEMRHASDVVLGSEKPSVALRSGRNSSMRQAIDSVAAGDADGIVSAGNTGALMAMAKFVFKTLPGVDRPAIASVFPSINGRTVLLDLGANVSCDAKNLVEFAVMGEVFARNVLKLKNPSVGILNVGEEDLKGNDSVRKAAAILQSSTLAIRFHGFVEGDDIAKGTVDVVVTDGFTGNIALKTAEGTARLYAEFLKRALTSSPIARLGALLAGPALRAMRARVDPRVYDGAMFLGLNGICVKSHGGTDSFGFSNAIRAAVDLVSDGVNEGIKQDFAYLSSGTPVDPKIAAG